MLSLQKPVPLPLSADRLLCPRQAIIATLIARFGVERCYKNKQDHRGYCSDPPGALRHLSHYFNQHVTSCCELQFSASCATLCKPLSSPILGSARPRALPRGTCRVGNVTACTSGLSRQLRDVREMSSSFQLVPGISRLFSWKVFLETPVNLEEKCAFVCCSSWLLTLNV